MFNETIGTSNKISIFKCAISRLRVSGADTKKVVTKLFPLFPVVFDGFLYLCCLWIFEIEREKKLPSLINHPLSTEPDVNRILSEMGYTFRILPDSRQKIATESIYWMRVKTEKYLFCFIVWIDAKLNEFIIGSSLESLLLLHTMHMQSNCVDTMWFFRSSIFSPFHKEHIAVCFVNVSLLSQGAYSLLSYSNIGILLIHYTNSFVFTSNAASPNQLKRYSALCIATEYTHNSGNSSSNLRAKYFADEYNFLASGKVNKRNWFGE